MYQAAHHELVASSLSVKAGHEINLDFKIGCMIPMVPIYPYSCGREDMVLSVQEMHTRYFFTDIQCSRPYPAYTRKMFEQKRDQIKMEPEDEKILADGCVDYIGFSYYMSSVVSLQSVRAILWMYFTSAMRNRSLSLRMDSAPWTSMTLI